ncbi:MAG: TetR family transcriptional regulator [Clostridia bacterium]|nr:TetR family transcriptional regulator [Clostridia bacterium]
MVSKQSFITEARREQIIKAAIDVICEIGYANVSLPQIAKKANISTGLISYHFSGKDDLINHTLMYLSQQEWSYISGKVGPKQTPTEKLIAFIEASIAYQVTHQVNNMALVEIVFNARTPERVPYYKIEDNEKDALYELLEEILCKGQESKEFCVFNPEVASTIIKGAISESMLNSKVNFEEYSEELIKIVLKMVK